MPSFQLNAKFNHSNLVTFFALITQNKVLVIHFVVREIVFGISYALSNAKNELILSTLSRYVLHHVQCFIAVVSV